MTQTNGYFTFQVIGKWLIIIQVLLKCNNLDIKKYMWNIE